MPTIKRSLASTTANLTTPATPSSAPVSTATKTPANTPSTPERPSPPPPAAPQAPLDFEAARALVNRGVNSLNADQRRHIIESLTRRPFIGGTALAPQFFSSDKAEAQKLVAALFTADQTGAELGSLLAEKGLALELTRQMDPHLLAGNPQLAAQLSGASLRQLSMTAGIADPSLPTSQQLQAPTVAQLEPLAMNSALRSTLNAFDRFDVLRAVFATARHSPPGANDTDNKRADISSAVMSDLSELQKQDLSRLLIDYLPKVPKWKALLGGPTAALKLERAIEAYAAREERLRDFGLMRLGTSAFQRVGSERALYELPKVAQGPQRRLAAEAAVRATRYVRDLDPSYEGISYRPGVVRGENIGTMTIWLHRRGGEATELGTIDMNSPTSYSVQGVMGQMAQLVNDHHYRRSAVAGAQEKPLPFVNQVSSLISPAAWKFGKTAQIVDGNFAGFLETASVPATDMHALLTQAGLSTANEQLPSDPNALVQLIKERLSKLGVTEQDLRIAGQPGTSSLKVVEGNRIQVDARVADVLANSKWVNEVAPARLFELHPANDLSFPELRPGKGYRFLRVVDGNPRFVMPAKAYLQYVGGGLQVMAEDKALNTPVTPESVRAHLENVLRDTYNVIPDVRLLPSGEIAIPPEHWSLLHRALGFELDLNANQFTYLNQERTAWLATAVYEEMKTPAFKRLMQSKGFFHEVTFGADGRATAQASAQLPSSFSASRKQPINSGYMVIEHDGAEVFVASNEQGVFVSVRGTQGMKDIATDLNAGLLGDKVVFAGWPGASDARAHPGFHAQNLAVRDEVARAVKYFNPQGTKKLVFAGHSKGGAEAVGLAAMMHLGWPGQPPVGTAQAVYTYGGARYFNKEGAQHYNDSPLGARTYAIQNHTEIVPHVPPRFLEYRQAGTLFRYTPDSDEVYEFGQEPDDWISDAKRLKGLVLGHLMNKYIAMGRARTALSTPALPGEYPRDTSIGPTSGNSL